MVSGQYRSVLILNINKFIAVDLMKKDSIEYRNFENNSKKFTNCKFYNLKSDIFLNFYYLAEFIHGTTF